MSEFSGKKILVVEDDASLILGLLDALAFEGFEVTHVADGDAGLAAARRQKPDLILLDIMLPGKSGLDVCRELRAAGDPVPIIMLTARGMEVDRVMGLKTGADDYLVKPFSLAELVARMESIWRREILSTKKADAAPFGFGDVVVNFHQHTAFRAGKELDLTPREFHILEYFANNPNRVVSRQELMREVWAYDDNVVSRTVDSHMANLRKKVEPNLERPQHLITVHRVGYKFKP